jgi:hypothetical protein
MGINLPHSLEPTDNRQHPDGETVHAWMAPGTLCATTGQREVFNGSEGIPHIYLTGHFPRGRSVSSRFAQHRRPGGGGGHSLFTCGVIPPMPSGCPNIHPHVVAPTAESSSIPSMSPGTEDVSGSSQKQSFLRFSSRDVSSLRSLCPVLINAHREQGPSAERPSSSPMAGICHRRSTGDSLSFVMESNVKARDMLQVYARVQIKGASGRRRPVNVCC